VSPWDSRRRGVRSIDLTWMPDELELAPDWVKEEVTMAPKELQNWLSTQLPINDTRIENSRPKGGRRGRRPRR
jgi:hypothetical protein